MSTMLKTRPRSTAMTKHAKHVEDAETGPPRDSAQIDRVGSAAEAPEDAIRESEPPESREEYHTEAPDAGRGECDSIEREFTHGRSWS